MRQLALECAALNSRDPHQERFERLRVGQECKLDEVADRESANPGPELDIVNAFPEAHFLDVFDLYGVVHDSFRPPIPRLSMVPRRRQKPERSRLFMVELRDDGFTGGLHEANLRLKTRQQCQKSGQHACVVSQHDLVAVARGGA